MNELMIFGILFLVGVIIHGAWQPILSCLETMRDIIAIIGISIWNIFCFCLKALWKLIGLCLIIWFICSMSAVGWIIAGLFYLAYCIIDEQQKTRAAIEYASRRNY